MGPGVAASDTRIYQPLQVCLMVRRRCRLASCIKSLPFSADAHKQEDKSVLLETRGCSSRWCMLNAISLGEEVWAVVNIREKRFRV